MLLEGREGFVRRRRIQVEHAESAPARLTTAQGHAGDIDRLLTEELADVGLSVTRFWTDDRNDFGLLLARRAR